MKEEFTKEDQGMIDLEDRWATALVSANKRVTKCEQEIEVLKEQLKESQIFNNYHKISIKDVLEVLIDELGYEARVQERTPTLTKRPIKEGG